MEMSEMLILVAVSVLAYLFMLLVGHCCKVPQVISSVAFVRTNYAEKNFALRLAKIYKKNRQPIIGIHQLGIKPCLLIRDLELVKLVLVKHFDFFQNRGLFYNEDDPLSAILGAVDHHLWRVMRRKVSPAFTACKLKQIFPQLKSAYDKLADNLIASNDSEEQFVDIVDALRCTSEAIRAVAFGNHNDESQVQLRKMISRAKKPFLTSYVNEIIDVFPGLPNFFGLTKYRKEASNFIVHFVSKIIQFRKENNVRANDFMQSWIDSGMETHRIAAIAFDLSSTGYSDSTSTLVYCLYELALNKNIQDLAREDIKIVLNNQDFSYESLQQMKYCNQIIKEAERKYPVGGVAMRVATQDFLIPNTEIKIPKGMKLYIPIYGIHHDDSYYQGPEVFNPDRFTEEAIATRHKYAFLPFGAGPRQCIGYRFAEMVIGIGLITLLKSFEFSTCSETQPVEFDRNKRTLHPKSGVTLKIRRIDR